MQRICFDVVVIATQLKFILNREIMKKSSFQSLTPFVLQPSSRAKVINLNRDP